MEIINRFYFYLALVAAMTLTSQLAFAVTADEVKCKQCVGKSDIKKAAVTKNRIKDGAVVMDKLGSDVLDMEAEQNEQINQNAENLEKAADEITKLKPKYNIMKVVRTDADGTMIGDMQIGGAPYFQVGGVLYRAFLKTDPAFIDDDTHLNYGWQEIYFAWEWILFDGPNCTGNAYIANGDINESEIRPLIHFNDILYTHADEESIIVIYSHYYNRDGCVNDEPVESGLRALVPVIDVSFYRKPFKTILVPDL